MQGNTNAIGVGNESALDLLQKINIAKKDLAVNLTSKGVTASASGETLSELVNKVADINPSDAELVPCVVMNSRVTSTLSVYQSQMLRIKDYIFFFGNTTGTDKTTNFIAYLDLREIENDPNFININNGYNMNPYLHYIDLPNNINSRWSCNSITVSKDASKLFVSSGYSGVTATGVNNLHIIDLVWDGDNLTSATLNKSVAIASPAAANKVRLLSISANSDGSKLLCIAIAGNDGSYDLSNVLFLYDVENDQCLSITGLKQQSTTISYESRICCPYFTKDDEFIVFYNNYSTNEEMYLDHYSLSGTTATPLSETITIPKNGAIYSAYLGNAVKIFEYETGKFKVFIPLRNYLDDYNNANNTLAIYDTYAKEISYVNSKMFFCNVTYSSDNHNYFVDILERENDYIVTTGYGMHIFDKNWNLIRNLSVNYSYFDGTGLFSRYLGMQVGFLTKTKMISFSFYTKENNSNKALSFPIYYAKRGVVKLTRSIEGTAKTFYYPLLDTINPEDIEAGYLD